jgi:ABC-type sugar transport system substrate-binding protein
MEGTPASAALCNIKKERRKMKKFISIVISVVMLAVLAGGCSSPVQEEASEPVAQTPEAAESAPAPVDTTPEAGSPAPAAEGEVGELAIVAMAMGMPYFESVRTGAEAYAEEHGYKLTFTGPASVDAAAQANVIQDLITKGVSAIAVSPIDSSSLEPVMKQASDAGIVVLTYDLDVDNEEFRSFYVNPLDNLAMARHMVDVMAGLMGEEGEVAILTGTVSNTVENERVAEMEKYLPATYPNMTLVTVETGEDDMQKSIEVATNMLTAYPELKGIICNSSVAVPGAGQAVLTAGKAGTVMVSGLSTPNECKDLVHKTLSRRCSSGTPAKWGRWRYRRW